MAESAKSAEPLARTICQIVGLDPDRWWTGLREVLVSSGSLETTWSSPLEVVAALKQLYLMCLAALNPLADVTGPPRAEATYSGKDGAGKRIKVRLNVSWASVRLELTPTEREALLEAYEKCLA